MRMIALSIALMSGAIMAGIGVIAQELPSSKHHNNLDEFGMVIAAVALLLLVIEFFRAFKRPQE